MRPVLFALLLLASLATPATAADWISSTSLEGFAELSAADRRRIAPLVEHRIIGYSFADSGIEWRIHSGDLKIPGNFDNESALIVDGSLEIAGSYDDYGAGSGLLIVLGDLSAEHVLTWNGLFVRGKVKATGLLYGVYNDYAFEAGGGVEARGIVMDDHSSSYEVLRAGFEVDNSEGADDEALGRMIRQLLPEILTDPSKLELDEYAELSYLWPAYDVTQQRVRSDQPIFRAQEAPARLVDETRLALHPETADDVLIGLLGHDPLTDRVVAARPVLSEKLIAALLKREDPGVRAWLAGHVTDLDRLGGPAALTVLTAERLVDNPQTPEKTLLDIARSPDTAVRRTLSQRRDLPNSVLALIARDADADVRAGVLFNYDNAERLPREDLVRLAKDPHLGVREAIAGTPLPCELAEALARDENPEVRLALAYTLAEEVDRPFPACPAAQREKIAEILFAGNDEAAAGIPAAVFTALAPARQLELFRQKEPRIDQVHWWEIAQRTRSTPLMAALVELEDELMIQGELAKNLALPVELQLRIVARATLAPAKKCTDCILFETNDDVVEALLHNANLAPQALAAAGRIVAARSDAVFAESVQTYTDLPPESLAIPLTDVAERSRKAPTYEERLQALELYQIRKLRSW